MSPAERLMIEAEIDAAEAKARRLREGLRETSATLRTPTRRPRQPTQPRAPSVEELAGVTSITDARVASDARRKGMIEK